MAQYQRLGLLKTAPAFTKLADEIVLTDIYEKAASEFGIDVPEDMQPIEIELDGATFDPTKPQEEAKRP
jgi:nitrate/nitrite transport system substrate-binding protein